MGCRFSGLIEIEYAKRIPRIVGEIVQTNEITDEV